MAEEGIMDNTTKKGEGNPVDPSKSNVPASISTGCGKGGRTLCEEFIREATPQKKLESLCFKHFKAKTTAIEEGIAGSGGSVAEVSCASSTCSLGGNGNLSDGGYSHGIKGNAAVVGPDRGIISEQINAKLLQRTTSRHGRSSQRWVADPSSHAAIRLTTGCVPIVKGGNVLFVSASSKPSWIFPKGGWENDEKMEESALREAYEEAGVIGILGPRLSEVQYETRKARKRRLETEEMLKRKQEKLETPCEAMQKDDKKEKKSDAACVSTADIASYDALASVPASSPKIVIDTSELRGKPTVNPAPLSDEAFAKMRRDVAKRHTDETSSIQSDTSSYNQVRMSLFPLYVTNIKNEWPESGRLRRAVPIDEAIQILQARPELQAALVEVKKRGLHLWRSVDAQQEKLPVI